MLLARLSSANCLQAFLCASLRRGFLLGRRPCKPTCCSVWRMVWALTSWPSTYAISKAMLAALMRLFFEASFCTWCTAQGLNCFDRPLRGLCWKLCSSKVENSEEKTRRLRIRSSAEFLYSMTCVVICSHRRSPLSHFYRVSYRYFWRRDS